MKRTRRYTVSSKSCLVARIQLLNNEFVEFTLSVESTGQESLEAVAQRLELREVSYERGCRLLWPGFMLAVCCGPRDTQSLLYLRCPSSACKPSL